MRVVFSMDGIKNMDQLYTWTKEQSKDFGCDVEVEHYHGQAYCKAIISSVTDWADCKYIGSCGRIANETFLLITEEGAEYTVSFAINTYEKKIARLEVTVTAQDTGAYDYKLEKLKIALKNKLIPDWQECTWLMDEQAARLCRDAYEQAFIVENNLRAFASKVLIHFLGVSWIRRAGLEKQAESVKNLKDKFLQRVPEFDDINTDFLSMTLETLVGILFDGVVYKDAVVLSRHEYEELQEMASKAKSPNFLANYLKAKRTVDKTVWDDLFVPYIIDSEAFKAAAHRFIEDRNHVAHSKVLSASAYHVIRKDFQEMDDLVQQASEKFDEDETSQELMETWEAEHEKNDNTEYEESYYRDRLAGETGIDILDEGAIEEWFDETVLKRLYSDIYQRYHLDVCYEVTDFTPPSDNNVVFEVYCPVDETGVIRIDVTAECSVDDELGGDSICFLVAANGEGAIISKAEICIHNGNGHEGEDGLMEVDEDTEYNDSELDGFKEDLFAAIDDLNPYPGLLDALVYESKGSEVFVADDPCEQCGQFGISLNTALLPLGKCCYCGYENEIGQCAKCGEYVSSLNNHGLCPSCAAYVDKQ